MRRLLVVTGLVAVLTAPQAGAQWSAAAAGTASIGAGQMTNASGLTAACTTTKASSSVTLQWTRSPDTYVGGYDLVRTGAGGGSNATYRLAATASSYVDTPGTGAGISYTYTIRAVMSTGSWVTSPLAATGTPTYSKTGCTTR